MIRQSLPSYLFPFLFFTFLLFSRAPGFQGLEEIVALVIDEDEGGEVFDVDLPDGLHAEFGILHALDALDGALREHGSHTADATQIEATILLTSLGHHIRTVTFGDHHQGSTQRLELIHIGIHTVGRGGTHRTARIAFGRLGRTGIKHGILLEVVGQSLAGIQTGLQLGMGDVAGHDDGALQVDTGRDRILRQLLANCVETLVQVDGDGVLTLSGLGELTR